MIGTTSAFQITVWTVCSPILFCFSALSCPVPLFPPPAPARQSYGVPYPSQLWIISDVWLESTSFLLVGPREPELMYDIRPCPPNALHRPVHTPTPGPALLSDRIYLACARICSALLQLFQLFQLFPVILFFFLICFFFCFFLPFGCLLRVSQCHFPVQA